MKPVGLLVLLVVCVLASASPRLCRGSDEDWTATSVAWLALGDDGKFVNPRVLCAPDAFFGVAFEERYKTWGRVGVSFYDAGDMKVTTLPPQRRVDGIAACLPPQGPLALLHGSDRAVYLSRVTKEGWFRDILSPCPGQALDIVASTGGRLVALFTAKDGSGSRLMMARETAVDWSISELTLPAEVLETGLPLTIGPARLALDADRRPAAVALACTEKTRHLCRARYAPGGMDVVTLPNHLAECVGEGRFGLAYDETDHLFLAYMERKTRKLLMADIDLDSAPVFEPDEGAVVRWPQVDLTFDDQGRPHVIYFAVTPDGGLQIRLARHIDGTWSSRMIDRTMSKNSLASCSVALQRGEDPFLSYALGPARAVLLAYPKHAAPPGIGK